MKKIIFLFIVIISLIGCKTLQIETYYGHKVKSFKEKEVRDKIEIYATIMDISKAERSPLTKISINSKDKNNNIKKTTKKVKIISNGKEYIINTKTERGLYYPVYEKDIIIDSDEFILELGKLEFDDGAILEVPPLLFKRYIYIYIGIIEY